MTRTIKKVKPDFDYLFKTSRPAAFISKGNEKTGIWSANLLAGDKAAPYDGSTPHKFDGMARPCGTCSGNCPGCYAKKMTRYDGTYTNYARNTVFAMTDPAAFVSSIEEQIYSGAMIPRYFRIHDSGDFFSFEYFAAWCDMIRRHPETRFGAYTKENEIVEKYGLENIPENFSLSCSPWPGHCDPIGDLPQFCYDDGSRPELATLPHCPAVDKNGKRTGVQCINCRHCYNAKRGDVWAVYAH